MLAWQRLMNNTFVQSDLRLLEHELAESLVIKGLENPYKPLHDIVNSIFNWLDNL